MPPPHRTPGLGHPVYCSACSLTSASIHPCDLLFSLSPILITCLHSIPDCMCISDTSLVSGVVLPVSSYFSVRTLPHVRVLICLCWEVSCMSFYSAIGLPLKKSFKSCSLQCFVINVPPKHIYKWPILSIKFYVAFAIKIFWDTVFSNYITFLWNCFSMYI